MCNTGNCGGECHADCKELPCCCGKVTLTACEDSVRLGDIVHERRGDGNFCGQYKNHELRVLQRENQKYHDFIADLRNKYSQISHYFDMLDRGLAGNIRCERFANEALQDTIKANKRFVELIKKDI